MPPKYKTILLDADMTLLDFQRSERESLRKVLLANNLPADDSVLSTYHKINDALWKAMARGQVDQDFLVRERFAALLRTLQLPGDPAALNHAYELGLAQEAWLLPGAMEFCRSLQQAGLDTAIATNGLPTAQWGRYRRTGLDQVVPHLLVSVELGAAKPSPLYFQRALEQLGNPPKEQCIMIGDTLETDVLGGNRAGLDTIWYNPDHLLPSETITPTYTASSYQEILDILGV